jgi:hypothetical protein
MTSNQKMDLEEDAETGGQICRFALCRVSPICVTTDHVCALSGFTKLPILTMSDRRSPSRVGRWT